MLPNLKVKTTFILFISCFSFLTVAVGASTFTAFSGQINSDNINVMVDATVNSSIVCILSKGAVIDVVSEAYDWYKIRLPKEAPSYVRKDLVECINTDPITNPGKCLSAKVIKDRVNIRQAPSESSWILGKINKLTVVNIVSDDGDWYRIQPVYQSYGWVNKKFINKNIAVLLKHEEPAIAKKDLVLPGQLIIEGTISPYGMVLWRTATHKLITSDNKVYFLKGNRKSLNSLNYCKVKVTGKLINTSNTKYPIVEIDMVEVLN